MKEQLRKIFGIIVLPFVMIWVGAVAILNGLALVLLTPVWFFCMPAGTVESVLGHIMAQYREGVPEIVKYVLAIKD